MEINVNDFGKEEYPTTSKITRKNGISEYYICGKKVFEKPEYNIRK